MMSAWSLKYRLLLGVIGCMVILLIAFSLIVYHSISRAMYRQFDASLESSAQLLAASLEQKKEGIGYEFDVEMVPEFAGSKKSYFQLWRQDGTSAGKSPSLNGKEDLTQFNSVGRWPAFKSFKMRDGQRVRAVAVKTAPRFERNEPNVSNSEITLVIAKDARQLFGQLRYLKYLLLFTSIGIIFVACGIAAIIVEKGLIPLNMVAAQIDNIKDDNLSNRISAEHLPTEIVPIQRRLNSLLSRLEASFERERAFNADVAHELRTPLAGIRSIIDVTLTRTRDNAEYRSALEECLDIAAKMQAMVDNLLTLARVESGQMKFGKEKIQPAALVDACWRAFSDKAAVAAIVFENKIDKNLILNSDEAGLSMAFSNLLDNAVEYTNQGGSICVSARKTENQVEIAIDNTGSRLTSEEAAKVFEYFWRGDTARQSDVHCGLGLSLVKKIVESLGGSVQAHVQNGLFSIRLALPL